VSVKRTQEPISELDIDEELEADLRRELIEIALNNGVSDPETPRDVLLSTLSGTVKVHRFASPALHV
jgi:hypothetical protein